MRLGEAPGEAREHQRDADLHAGEQERVVVGVRVAHVADAAADVEAMREAAAGELRDEREQAERERGEQPLVPAATLKCATRRRAPQTLSPGASVTSRSDARRRARRA